MADQSSGVSQSDTFIHSLTIRQLEDWVTEQHRKITTTFEFQEIGSIRLVLHQLSTARHELDALINSVSDTHSTINSRLNDRVRVFRRELQMIPTNDAVMVEESTNDNNPQQYGKDSGIEFAPNIEARDITVVKDLASIPDTRLYWITDLQQFAFKICGVVMRGNIGSIYQSVHSSNKQVVKINPCRYGKQCRHVNTPSGCNYYHDPIDGPPGKSNDIRNFTNGSWLYTPDLPKDANKMMRHIGNRQTILADLNHVSGTEARCWIDQTMHTLLVAIVLHQQGYMTRRRPSFDDHIMSSSTSANCSPIIIPQKNQPHSPMPPVPPL